VTWAKLLAENRVAPEPASKQEIDNLRSIVTRCTADMAVAGLSDEQRFLIAYDAARTLSLIIVRASGYRPKKLGGHYNTFMALKAVGPGFASAGDYFDLCRLKRNDSEYDFAGGISETDADNLVSEVQKFQKAIEAWLQSHHPVLL
jgi:hypothetical protein